MWSSVACPSAPRVHFGVNLGLQYAHRSAHVELKGTQTYRAGYDVTEHYANPVFHAGVAGAANYAGVFHDNTPDNVREGYILHHQVPQSVRTDANVAEPLQAGDLDVWAYGANGLDSQHFVKHGRSVESSGGFSVARSALGLRVDLEAYTDIQRVRVGAWAAYVHYFDFDDKAQELASSVPHNEALKVGGFFVPYSMESKAYEPYGFKMLFSEKATIQWRDYGRYGVFLGCRLSNALSFELRLGLRYVFGTLRMKGLKMFYPYAHRTYDEQVAPQGAGIVDFGNVELNGGGWAPVFGVYARVHMMSRHGLFFGAEFANADIDLKWSTPGRAVDGEAKRTVQNPIKGVSSANLVRPSGWHMTYVDELNLSMQAHVSATEISLCAMYNMRF